MKTIYMDHAATTPVRREVLEAMLPFFCEKFGNPGSLHSMGEEAREALEDARESVAKVLGAKPQEIIFTGSGTESCNLAIIGFARTNRAKGKHIVTQKTEHRAVLDSCAALEKEGFEVTYLPVDNHGRADPEKLKTAIRKDTILVSIMYANNEIGTVQPVRELAKVAHEKGVVFHTDACQAGGLLDVNMQNLGADMMSLNGGKIYGPKGIGALFVKTGVKLEPIIHGGGQESGLRSGTENVPAIAGFAKALELAQAERENEVQKLAKLRDALLMGLKEKIPGCVLNGHPTERLPNNLNISIRGADGDSLVLLLSDEGICVSTGSACTSRSAEPSHVLKALGLPEKIITGSLRFSLGRDSTGEDVKRVLEVLPPLVERAGRQ